MVPEKVCLQQPFELSETMQKAYRYVEAFICVNHEFDRQTDGRTDGRTDRLWSPKNAPFYTVVLPNRNNAAP